MSNSNPYVNTGEVLPPFIIYNGKNFLQRWMEDAPSNILFSMSKSGWIEETNFSEWFDKVFMSAVKSLLDTGPVFLLLDSCTSHHSIPMLQSARENGIIIYCLPPHATHILQPLDVCLFSPLKKE
jgi:hypothetical protein